MVAARGEPAAAPAYVWHGIGRCSAACAGATSARVVGAVARGGRRRRLAAADAARPARCPSASARPLVEPGRRGRRGGRAAARGRGAAARASAAEARRRSDRGGGRGRGRAVARAAGVGRAAPAPGRSRRAAADAGAAAGSDGGAGAGGVRVRAAAEGARARNVNCGWVGSEEPAAVRSHGRVRALSETPCTTDDDRAAAGRPRREDRRPTARSAAGVRARPGALRPTCRAPAPSRGCRRSARRSSRPDRAR